MNNLRKLTVISMVTAILLCTCIASSVAEVLSFSPGVNMDNVSTAFLQEHPNVELITDGIWYDTTSELVGAMLTRSFQGDIFALNTMAKDLSILYSMDIVWTCPQAALSPKPSHGCIPPLRSR